MVKIKKRRPSELDGIAIVGIDPSSVKLAVVALTARGFFAREYVLAKKSGAEACSAAIAAAEDIAAYSDAAMKLAFIERPAVGVAGINVTMVQAFTSGALQGGLLNGGYQVTLVPPSTWKAGALGNGRADKAEVARIVRQRWAFAFSEIAKSQDLIDAFAIAVYGGRKVLGPGFMADGSEMPRAANPVLRS